MQSFGAVPASILRRLRYGMRLFSFTHCASPSSYCTIVHDSQWAKAASEQTTPSKYYADVYAAARDTPTSKSGQNASRPVITRGNIDDDAALLRRIDINITSFDNIWWNFRRLGENRHRLLSSMDKTKQYWRRYSALASHRLQYYVVWYAFLIV